MWRCQAPLTFVQPLPVYGMDNVLLLLCKKGYNSPYLWVVVLVSHLGSIVVTTWTTSMPAAAIVNFSGSSWSKENKQEEVISVLLLLLSLQKALWKEHQRLLGGFEEIPSGYVRSLLMRSQLVYLEAEIGKSALSKIFLLTRIGLRIFAAIEFVDKNRLFSVKNTHTHIEAKLRDQL